MYPGEACGYVVPLKIAVGRIARAGYFGGEGIHQLPRVGEERIKGTSTAQTGLAFEKRDVVGAEAVQTVVAAEVAAGGAGAGLFAMGAPSKEQGEEIRNGLLDGGEQPAEAGGRHLEKFAKFEEDGTVEVRRGQQVEIGKNRGM